MKLELVANKWFAGDHPVNGKPAIYELEESAVKILTIESRVNGTDWDDYTVSVIDTSGSGDDYEDLDLTVEVIDEVLTIFLGTDASGDLDATKNTATLVAAEINKLADFKCTVATGKGATVIVTEVDEDDFEGGQLCTPAPAPYTIYFYDDYYYVNIEPCTERDAGWRKFALATY